MVAYGRSSSFKSELRRCLTLQSDGWLVAEKDRNLVGMVGTVDYGPIAYVGLMGVHPAAQGQGIGGVLLNQLLLWLDRRGCPLALLDATEAGTGLYTKFGFVEDEKSWVFDLGDGRQLQTCEQVSRLRLIDLAALSAFDAPIFGANRQAVFATYLRELPERAFITRDQTGQISGYLFAQSKSLGPWAASTPEAAQMLLAAALSLSFDSTPRVLVPGSNPSARDLLLSWGFREQRALSHMRRGRNTAPAQRCKLYGLASFAIG